MHRGECCADSPADIEPRGSVPVETLGIGRAELCQTDTCSRPPQPDLPPVIVARQDQGNPVPGRPGKDLRVVRQENRRDGRIESPQGGVKVRFPGGSRRAASFPGHRRSCRHTPHRIRSAGGERQTDHPLPSGEKACALRWRTRILGVRPAFDRNEGSVAPVQSIATSRRELQFPSCRRVPESRPAPDQASCGESRGDVSWTRSRSAGQR